MQGCQLEKELNYEQVALVVWQHKSSCSVMGIFAHTAGSPRLLRGEGTRTWTAGGRECTWEAISFSTFDFHICIEIILAMNRVERNKNRPPRCFYLHFGDYAEYNTVQLHSSFPFNTCQVLIEAFRTATFDP